MPAGVAGTFIMRLHLPVRPGLAQLDVAGHALGVRRTELGIFQQRIELEAHVAVVAVRLFPDRTKHGLRLAHQLVGHPPGDLLVGQLLLDQLLHVVVEAAGLDQVGDDDRIRGGAGGPQGPILGDQLGIDRIEPDLGATGNQRAKR